MEREQIIFSPQGGIDTDSDARAVIKGDYRMFEYCRLGQTVGEGFTVVTSRGTILIDNPDVTSTDTIMGTGIWQKQNSIVYLVNKELGGGEIWIYRLDSGTHELVCQSAAFFFNVDWKYYHFDVVDDIAKFTCGYWEDQQYEDDGTPLFNPPYQINLQKALDGEYPVIDLQVIDAIKWPPKPPTCIYGTDQTRADNKLRRKLFRFRIQYIYENAEETAWSMWSNLALPTKSEFVSGTNWPDPSEDNKLILSFETGPNVVKKINVAVMQFDDNSGGAENQFGLFLQIDKAADSVPDNSVYVYDFYGNVSTKPISNFSKNYDRLPLTARCQSVIEASRIAYTNFREGYDKLEVDVEVNRVLTEIQQKTRFLEVEWVTTTFAPDYFNVLEIGTDSTVFDGQVGDIYSGTLRLVTTGDPFVNPLFLITQEIYDDIISNVDPLYRFFELLTQSFVDQINDVAGSGFVEAYPPSTAPYPSPSWTIWGGTAGVVYFTSTPRRLLNSQRQTLATPSLKTGATHRFGIMYGDRAFRDGTVLTNDAMSLFVPFYGQDSQTAPFLDPNNPYTVLSEFTVNHIPPIWAEHYWFVSQKTTEIADFSQWIINSELDLPAINPTSTGDGRYVISLDKFYLEKYTGATINHTPQKGDIARFIRKRVENTANPPAAPYLETYFELEVQEFLPTGGIGNRNAIVVERFDLTILDPTLWTGQMIEIYTPRPALDTDGSLFVAEWRDISEALPILNPHTENRVHGGSTRTGTVQTTSGSDDYVFLNGDFEYLLGYTVTINLTSGDVSGVVTQASYDNINNETAIEILGVTADATELVTWSATLNQTSTLSAIYDSNYGDVYVRQRNYATGYNAPFQNGYWFVEDPHYSDYWLSDIHQVGRVEVEDPNAKLTHRFAASIHSDVYIQDTQINGLSSFSLLNDNIQDMNPVYGEVIRTFLSGREDKTLKCIQPRKENSIYIQHYPQEALATGNLIINKTQTFAAWYPYKGIFGCSDTGASALWSDGSTFYFDRINGVFVQSSTNGQVLISERSEGRDFKFRKKTKELTARLNSDPNAYVRCYVDQLEGEIGFCFAFSIEGGYEYEIYAFDVMNMRWRTKYDYNFNWFQNFGQTLVGWGSDNNFYLHNQNSITFHGENFIQKVNFVSNDNPLVIKRYQDMVQRSNKPFSVYVFAEPNQSYTQMATSMGVNLFDLFDGYNFVDYRKNRFSQGYATEELAEMNGEDITAHSVTHELSYDPTEYDEGAILFSIEIKYINT